MQPDVGFENGKQLFPSDASDPGLNGKFRQVIQEQLRPIGKMLFLDGQVVVVPRVENRQELGSVWGKRT
jgi:hypothetical protein